MLSIIFFFYIRIIVVMRKKGNSKLNESFYFFICVCMVKLMIFCNVWLINGEKRIFT